MVPPTLQIVLLIGALVAIETVIVLTAWWVGSQQAKELGRRFLTQLCMIFLVLVPAYLGGVTLWLVLTALAWRAQYELYHVGGRSRDGCLIGHYFLGAVTVAGAFYLETFVALRILGLAVVVGAMLPKPGVDRKLARVTGSGMFYPVVPVAVLAMIANLDGRFGLLFLIYAVAEVHDTVAFFVGRMVGRIHIIPSLSPGKTAEGFAAGVVVAFTLSLLLGQWLFAWSLPHAVAMSVAVVLGSIVGDLVASKLKRLSGVKDFPGIVAHHDGTLDGFDSLLLAAVIFYTVYVWLQ